MGSKECKTFSFSFNLPIYELTRVTARLNLTLTAMRPQHPTTTMEAKVPRCVQGSTWLMMLPLGMSRLAVRSPPLPRWQMMLLLWSSLLRLLFQLLYERYYDGMD